MKIGALETETRGVALPPQGIRRSRRLDRRWCGNRCKVAHYRSCRQTSPTRAGPEGGSGTLGRNAPLWATQYGKPWLRGIKGWPRADVERSRAPRCCGSCPPGRGFSMPCSDTKLRGRVAALVDTICWTRSNSPCVGSDIADTGTSAPAGWNPRTEGCIRPRRRWPWCPPTFPRRTSTVM